MPVNATPSGNPGDCNTPGSPGATPAPVITPLSPTCLNQRILVAKTPTDPGTGVPILSRTHAYNITGAKDVCIDHIMRDVNGNPVNIGGCLGIETPDPPAAALPGCAVDTVSSSSSNSSSSSDPSSVSSESSVSSSQSSSSSEAFVCTGHKIVFRMGEYLTCGGVEFPVEVIDAAVGHVRVCLLAADTNCAGVYFGEFAIVELSPNPDILEPTDDTECCQAVIFSNNVYVIIGSNLWGTRMCNAGPQGPPSVAEVRLHLRDTSPAESYLLDNLAFSDEEIAQALWMPVQYWNEIPPPISTYSTKNFPFRFHWLMATAGYLFLIAAEQHRRNNLQYSAGGVAVNDNNKEPNYEDAAHRRINEYKDFVKRKKASLNLEMGYGHLGSPTVTAVIVEVVR